MATAVPAILFALTGAFGTAIARDAPSQAPRRIAISVDEEGFSPRKIEVAKGERVSLVFYRTTDRTCAKKVLVYLSDDETVERDLPLGRPVAITVRFARAGELGYACAMGHVAGIIRVR